MNCGDQTLMAYEFAIYPMKVYFMAYKNLVIILP